MRLNELPISLHRTVESTRTRLVLAPLAETLLCRESPPRNPTLHRYTSDPIIEPCRDRHTPDRRGCPSSAPESRSDMEGQPWLINAARIYASNLFFYHAYSGRRLEFQDRYFVHFPGHLPKNEPSVNGIRTIRGGILT